MLLAIHQLRLRSNSPWRRSDPPKQEKYLKQVAPVSFPEYQLAPAFCGSTM